MTSSALKQRGMCVATRCTSVEQFIQMFHRFVEADSFFVSTVNTRPPGLETPFAVQLADGTPVLRGACVVRQAWTKSNSPFHTPGLELGVLHLTTSSKAIFAQLLAARAAASSPTPESAPPPTPHPPAPPPPHPPPPAAPRPPTSAPPHVLPPPVREAASPPIASAADPVAAQLESRTPGSELVLPANPLMNLTDESLEGYIDCTLYEETGSYFVEEGDTDDPLDDIVPPPAPALAPRPAVRGPRMISIPRARRTRWWFVGGVGGAAAAIAIIAFGVRAANSSAPAPAPTPAVVPSVEPAHPEPTPPPIVPRAPDAPAEIERAAPVASKVDDPDAGAEPDAVDAVDARGEAEGGGSGPRSVDDPTAAVVGIGPCRISVASTPAGSMVLLDGQVMGPSPIMLAASCGRHRVDIKHPRYKPATAFVAPAADQPERIESYLSRPTHAVAVISTPPGATVFIDGRRAGTTPTTLNVLGFQTVKLEIKKSGYLPVTTKLYSKVAHDRVAIQLRSW
jgi:hypothetical protein